MNSEQIFGLGLGLTAPWQVESVDFKEDGHGGKELHLTIVFMKSSRFMDGHGQSCPVHDRAPKRTWQHVSFFEHVCYLHCRVPRILETGCGKSRRQPSSPSYSSRKPSSRTGAGSCASSIRT